MCMGRIGETLAFMLTLIIAVSCLTLLAVKPADAQSGQTPNYPDYIPNPAVPQFTLKLVQSSYDEVVTDPFTGAETTHSVNNSTIEITITNQPFRPYNYVWECKGEVVNRSTTLWYDVQTKGHYAKSWTEVRVDQSSTLYSTESNTQSNNSEYTVISLPQDSIMDSAAYPNGGAVNFRVRAMAGGWFPPVLSSNINLPLNFISKNSSWTNTQTLTIPADSSASPSPTVPEFSWLAIVPLLLSVFALAVIVKHRKTPCIDRNSTVTT